MVAGTVLGVGDRLIMRVLDVVFAFPLVLLAIALSRTLTPNVGTEIISITIVLVPYVARLAHYRTRRHRVPFIEAARAGGASEGATRPLYPA
jgi:peptide/nickel transport system permease protein